MRDLLVVPVRWLAIGSMTEFAGAVQSVFSNPKMRLKQLRSSGRFGSTVNGLEQ